MATKFTLLGYDFTVEPTLLQRRVAGRMLCLMLAIPLAVAVFSPVVQLAVDMQ